MSKKVESEVNQVERNELLEMDGLYFQSDTHEWFHDKVCTRHARNEDSKGIALKHIVAFIVREKSSGKYDRVLMDSNTNTVIYDSPSMEAIASYIDRLKVSKHFEAGK
jgi:hypothetical protein